MNAGPDEILTTRDDDRRAKGFAPRPARRTVGIWRLQGPKIRVGKFADGRITLLPVKVDLDAQCPLGDQAAGRSDLRTCPATPAILLLDHGPA